MVKRMRETTTEECTEGEVEDLIQYGTQQLRLENSAKKDMYKNRSKAEGNRCSNRFGKLLWSSAGRRR